MTAPPPTAREEEPTRLVYLRQWVEQWRNTPERAYLNRSAEIREGDAGLIIAYVDSLRAARGMTDVSRRDYIDALDWASRELLNKYGARTDGIVAMERLRDWLAAQTAPPNAPTAADRAGEDAFGTLRQSVEAAFARGDLSLDDVHDTYQAYGVGLIKQLAEAQSALLAARRENEASAALRERVRLEAASLDDYANGLAEGTLTGRVLVGASRRLMDAYRAALAAAHGEDR